MTVYECLFFNISFIVIGVVGIFITAVGLKRSMIFLIPLVGTLCIALSGSAGIILLRSLGTELERKWRDILLFYMNELGIILALILFLVTFSVLAVKWGRTVK